MLKVGIVVAALALTACSGTESKGPGSGSNNGGGNNGASNNNGTSNNGASNNGTSNNGTNTNGLACDDLSSRLSAARSGCETTEDCIVRSAMCSCPAAIRADADQSGIDELLESCDYSETCSLIDCQTGLNADCQDGTCVLVD